MHKVALGFHTRQPQREGAKHPTHPGQRKVRNSLQWMIEILPVAFHFFSACAVASVKLACGACPPHPPKSMLTGRIFKTQHPPSRTTPTLSSGVAGGTDPKHSMASSWLHAACHWQNKYHQQSGTSISLHVQVIGVATVTLTVNAQSTHSQRYSQRTVNAGKNHYFRTFPEEGVTWVG